MQISSALFRGGFQKSIITAQMPAEIIRSVMVLHALTLEEFPRLSRGGDLPWKSCRDCREGVTYLGRVAVTIERGRPRACSHHVRNHCNDGTSNTWVGECGIGKGCSLSGRGLIIKIFTVYECIRGGWKWIGLQYPVPWYTLIIWFFRIVTI